MFWTAGKKAIPRALPVFTSKFSLKRKNLILPSIFLLNHISEIKSKTEIAWRVGKWEQKWRNSCLLVCLVVFHMSHIWITVDKLSPESKTELDGGQSNAPHPSSWLSRLLPDWCSKAKINPLLGWLWWARGSPITNKHPGCLVDKTEKTRTATKSPNMQGANKVISKAISTSALNVVVPGWKTHLCFPS